MKKIYLSLVAVAMAGGAMAQAPYVSQQYDFAKTDKHSGQITTIDGRTFDSGDRMDFYTEDFDAMSALDGTGTNWEANTTTGPVDFELTSTGHANDAGSTFVIPALATGTPTQWILFDSDSDGTSGTEEGATLTSPVIDLTDGGSVTVPAALKIEFEQFYAGWQSDTIYVAISDDGGSTWDEVEIANNSVGREGRPNPEIVSINISPYIVDQTNVRIRFRWAGNWDYGWQLDNVKISELPDNDMRIVRAYRGDIANGFMYSKVPEAQAQEFVIGADVQNIGFATQTNIFIDWEIFDPSMTSVGSGTSVASIASLDNGENDTIWISTGITPTALGDYTIDFEVTSDAVDDVPANNTAQDTDFELTEAIYASDYGDPSGAFYNWAGNSVENGIASIGNVFEIVADGVVGAIDAELDDNAQVVDQLIYHKVYLWDGTDFFEEETSPDYTTVASDEGNMVRLVLEDPVNVVAGDLILVVAGHLGGDPSAGWELSSPVGDGSVQGFLDDGSRVSLITPSAPVVRAVMIDFTEDEEELEKMENFSIYPNPANDFLVVNLTLFESENTVVNVLDITGKVVETINLGTVNGDSKVNIDLNEYNSGVYFIEMTNEEGRQVKKFIKK